MEYGAFTGYFDVAQVTLYAFWIFFFGLILYLRREDKREGYPLIFDRAVPEAHRWQGIPSPKKFLLHDGTVVLAPRAEPPVDVHGTPSASFPGAPLNPTGNPMLAAMGPGAYANRADHPDLAYDDNLPKIIPLRSAADFYLALEDVDPRGMDVYGADGVLAGKIVDAWIDRSEVVLRYFEVELTSGRRVLLPTLFADIKNKTRQIRVSSIMGDQFADVPALKNPEIVTLLEEDKVSAYYAGGTLYAAPGRLSPVI